MLSIPLRRVRAGEVCCEEFLYILKASLRAAACGGRPRPAGPSRDATPWSGTVRLWHQDSGAYSSGSGSFNPKEAPAHRSGRPMCARHAAHSLPSAPRTSTKPGTSISAA